MDRVFENDKITIGLTPQALNGTATGRYFDVSDSAAVLAVVEIGAMAKDATCAIKLKEAKDADGTDAADISGATCTITANTNVTSAKIVVTSPANGKVVVVNGITMTKAAATATASKEFANADGLAACINAACDGLTATNAAGTITILVDDVDATLITLTSNDATNLTVSTLSAIAYVDLVVDNLQINDGFTHVALVVTNSASMTVSGTLVRYGNRHKPVVQKVAANKEM